jgi:hypothetical protein
MKTTALPQCPRSPRFRHAALILLRESLTILHLQATSRIRKDVVSLAAQASELHATVNSAQALGISGGNGKSVAEVVDMTKEIQVLNKKVDKLKAQKKAQVCALDLFIDLLAFVLCVLIHSTGTEAGRTPSMGGFCADASFYA